MREARKNHGLVFVNERIYAVGGQNGMGMICCCWSCPLFCHKCLLGEFSFLWEIN